jgi:hypothetical protein
MVKCGVLFEVRTGFLNIKPNELYKRSTALTFPCALNTIQTPWMRDPLEKLIITALMMEALRTSETSV